jgi:hypothetical protein
MIRSRRLTPSLLKAWLVEQELKATHQRYRVRLWRENRAEFGAIEAELVLYINEAFDDARRRLRAGFEDNLSPFNDPTGDPAANYPSLLHRETLQGYFGEIMGVLAVEHWGAHGHSDWTTPAFLFRLHNVEFEHLESLNGRLRSGTLDPDSPDERRPGRTGDDGLTFRMNSDTIITDILAIEAKCLRENKSNKIEQAYSKLAQGSLLPTGIHELITLLSDYDTMEAMIWQQALVRLWRDRSRNAGRHDCVAYSCGRSPSQGDRLAWLPTDAPHPKYTINRNLEGLEFQFEDIDTLINTLFRGQQNADGGDPTDHQGSARDAGGESAHRAPSEVI